METPLIVKLNTDNIADEHICCAFSDKKCAEGYQAKKDWLAAQFEDGYTFRKLNVRGKVFIEYVPAEKGWLPIKANGYMLINCFWVSGQFKGRGHARELLLACEQDAKEMYGLVAVVAKKKQPFLSEKKFYIKKGFEVCDSAEPYFELLYKPFTENAPIPKFKEIAKQGRCDVENGLSVYYTNACPFTEYYVNTELKTVAKKKGIPLEINKLETRQQAQNHFVPHSIYSVFYNGKFVTQHILNEKYFDKFIKV